MKRRFFSIFCALCLGLLPTAAFALDGDKTIMLGTSVLQKNANTADAATVYFGRKEDGNPAAWRVISYNGSGVAGAG
ncbi:MAG: hypothetical protein Q3Y08_10550 [Butyricicoccus sp.]|nr:hypothetical protein [Butyricicoccus sp.]